MNKMRWYKYGNTHQLRQLRAVECDSPLSTNIIIFLLIVFIIIIIMIIIIIIVSHRWVTTCSAKWVQLTMRLFRGTSRFLWQTVRWWLHYSQAVNTRMIRILWVMTMVKGLLSQSWHIHIQYVTRNHGQQIMVTTGLLWWGLLGTARALTGDIYNDAHNRKCGKIVMIQIMNEWWS